ncbi:MAG: hypothetical protein CL792_05465, partial [Chloroflexi bacterium]|nr:hypothetical protein [Chloroflexota bacterium]
GVLVSVGIGGTTVGIGGTTVGIGGTTVGIGGTTVIAVAVATRSFDIAISSRNSINSSESVVPVHAKVPKIIHVSNKNFFIDFIYVILQSL